MSGAWTGRRALVTGAGGFIGSNLVRRLLAEGAQTHVLVRPRADLARLADLWPRLHTYEADLRDRAALAAALRHAEPDVLFHLAAAGVLGRPADAGELLAVNALGTAALLDAADEVSFRRFVHVGGSSEYGPHDRPLRESDALRPVTPYGASKAAATRVALQFGRERGRAVVALRPFSVYGPGEAPSRLVPSAIAAALRDTVLPLTPPGYRRDLVHVDDVVDACLLAAVHASAPGHVFNVGTGSQWTNEEAVSAAARACGRPVRTRPGAYAPHASDTPCWVADTSKTRRVLGWTARLGLEDGMRGTAAWWAARVGEPVAP